MSRVESVPTGGATRPPAPRKRAKLENTSFDLALAQALSGKDAASQSPKPRAPEPESPPADGSRDAAPPKDAAGADGPGNNRTDGGACSPVADGGTKAEAQNTEGEEQLPANSNPEASGPGPKPEPTAAAPGIESARIEAEFVRGPASTGAGRPASESSGAVTGARATSASDAVLPDEDAEPAAPSMRSPETQDAPDTSTASHAAATGRVTLRFEEEGGSSGRMRLAVRGRALHATIVSSDTDSVRRWNDDIESLHRSLLNQGFAEARVTVRQTEPSDPTRSTRRDSRDPDTDAGTRDRSAQTHGRGSEDRRLDL